MEYSQGAPQESLAVPLQRQKEPRKALCSQGFHLYFLWRNFLCWQLNCHKCGASPSQRQAFSFFLAHPGCLTAGRASPQQQWNGKITFRKHCDLSSHMVVSGGIKAQILNLAHIRRVRLSLLVERRGWLHWAKLLFWFSCGSFTVL